MLVGNHVTFLHLHSVHANILRRSPNSRVVEASMSSNLVCYSTIAQLESRIKV